MDNFTCADRGQVSVTLIGKDSLRGMGALDAGGHGRGAAVGGLLHVTGEILEGKDRAAHRAHADGLVQQSQLHQALGYQFVNDAMVAARAVMGFNVCQTLRLLVYDCHVT